jgi:hypothetical protein
LWGVVDLTCFLGPGSPQASVYGIPSIRGYNPLDVARYRKFLAFIADQNPTTGAFGNGFTHPVVPAFTTSGPIPNRPLLDLLGVRFQITAPDDPRLGDHWTPVANALYARSYNFTGVGIEYVWPLTIFENPSVMPRAFVLADAVPQAPEGQVLAQLKAIDVRRTATLEDWDPAADPLPRSGSEPGPAVIRSHQPNEIVIDLDGRTAGLLVLTDPWYPGWVCRIDGSETKIWKADYAFRGVFVPEGAREVVFRFEPRSFRQGKWVSLVTLVGVGVFFAVSIVRRRR